MVGSGWVWRVKLTSLRRETPKQMQTLSSISIEISSWLKGSAAVTATAALQGLLPAVTVQAQVADDPW